MKQPGDFIADTLTNDGQISEEQKNIYAYLFNYLVEALVFDIIVLLAGIIAHRTQTVLCYLAVTIPLRHFAGGFHADTRLGCTIFSYGVCGLFLLISPMLTFIPAYFWLTAYVLLWILLLIKAPVDTPNKRLTKDQKNKLFRLCILTCIIMSAAMLLICISGNRLCMSGITLSLFICTAGVYIGILRNRRIK